MTIKKLLKSPFIFILTLISLLAPFTAIGQASYENFKVAIYVRAYEVAQMEDIQWLEDNFANIERSLSVDKIYLETHRDRMVVEEDTLQQAIQFFKDKGMEVAGGITLTISEPNRFETFCYSDPEHRDWVQEVVEYTASHFDELILDDFFFTSCKNEIEIEAKGDRSWTEYRTALLRDAANDIVINPAKAINPDVKVVVKYPNWYEHFQGLGFNLETQPHDFDGIYTGTETRDAASSAQHLQQYHGYQIFRYFDNLNPGHNGGGWVDIAGSRTMDRYAEQLWMTLFAKAPEITLFEFSQIQTPVTDRLRGQWQDQDSSFDFDGLLEKSGNNEANFAMAAGQAFDTVDSFIGRLGNPVGVQSYRPYHATGEDFLHNYLGMIGIPIDMHPHFPTEAGTVLLTESAKFDNDIVNKIETHVRAGNNVVITSGLLEALEDRGIDQIAELQLTSRKALVKQFQARAYAPMVEIDEPILIPQLQYLTNDSWELVSAISGTNGWPLLHDADYNDGHLYVLVIPDNFADLYRLPAEVLTSFRQTISQDLGVHIAGPSQISLFVYDNDTVIVQSFRDEAAEISLVTNNSITNVTDILSEESLSSIEQRASGGFGAPRVEAMKRYEFSLPAHSFRVFKLNE